MTSSTPLPTIVTLDDLVTIFGVSERTPSVWRQRHLLPPPLRNLYGDRMPIWQFEDIKRWAKETGRDIVRFPTPPTPGKLPHNPF